MSIQGLASKGSEGDGFGFRQDVGVKVESPHRSLVELMLKGRYEVECFDQHGNLKWKETAENQVKNQGLDHMESVVFKSGTQVATWFIGLVNSGGTTNTAGDTAASHAGWTEFTSYSGGVRLAAVLGSPSGGVITSSSTTDFSITGSGTIMGIFLQSVNTGTGGTLWSTADFASPQTVANLDVLKITYTLTASSTS